MKREHAVRGKTQGDHMTTVLSAKYFKFVCYITLIWNKASSEATFPKLNSHTNKVSLYQHMFYYLTIIFYVITWNVYHLSSNGLKWDGRAEQVETRTKSKALSHRQQEYSRGTNMLITYKALRVSPGTPQ